MPSASPYLDRETVRHFWHANLRHKRLMLLALIYLPGSVCISIGIPYFISKIFAAIATPGGDPSRYLPWLIAITVIGLIANRIGFVRLMSFQAHVMADLQEDTLRMLLSRSVGFHNNNVSGRIVSDAIDYPRAYLDLINALCINILPFSLSIVVGVCIVMVHSWIIGLALFVMVLVTLSWAIIESQWRAHLRHKRMQAGKEVTSHLSDTIINTQTVKTFARETRELQEHKRLNRILLGLRLHDWQLSARSGNNRIATLLFMQVLFIALIIKVVEDSPALLGVGIFAFTYTLSLIGRLFEINAMIRTVEESLLAAAPMVELMGQTPEILDRPKAKPLEVTQGKVELQKVGFKYSDATTEKVFSDLSLTLAPKEKVGIVGPSGGGKTTLTRLLLRFEDIQSGRILIDGQDVAGVTQDSLHQAISYVPQEPLLFHRSVRENILYGSPDASDAKLDSAARKAHALEFIQALPSGFDTIVGERGVKLSGGQKQRVAIARAILKDSPILLLDEATSALDSESEKVIQEALWELMAERTVLVIAHRLSTIQRLDRIVVLDNGKIIEQGTHKQLLEGKGLYAKLWAHQSGGFLED